MDNSELRKLIREVVEQVVNDVVDQVVNEEELDEERISNPEAAEKVKQRQNFIGSHTYGEDLGELGKMYVAYSYGEQHPLYLWFNDNWYYNMDEYILDDGTPNIWTKKHLKDLNPGKDAKARSIKWMTKTINRFKKLNSIGDNSHSDLEPGEK